MTPGDHAEPAARRPLTPHDLSCLEQLPDAALSPDGRRLAYVRMRPRRTAAFHKHDFLSGGDRCDVWLVDTAGGAPENLTRGAEDGSGHWAPRWSPDGKRLALLSTRGADVQAWVCDVGSQTLHRLCARAVDLGFHSSPMLWVSDEEILLATLPEDERSGWMTVEIRAAEIAMREWTKAWKGLESTASVLDSGTAEPFDQRPQGALMLVDAATGVERTVMSGLFRDLRLAPDGRHVAFFRQVDLRRPHADGKLQRLGERVARL
ncbi:MAG: PD40 domain-containing protein, partial [Solirubrobacterales bacterium]|nr:PD40 domain-containing protein [Solirubrobacterales bacterium]